MKIDPPLFWLVRPNFLLQAEALLALLGSCWGIHALYPHHWGRFALLFFVPDLSLLGYVGGRWKQAPALYNLVHSYALPLCLGLAACLGSYREAGFISLLWMSHISFDRLLGYGLKFPGLFKYTHIQRSQTARGVPADAV